VARTRASKASGSKIVKTLADDYADLKESWQMAVSILEKCQEQLKEDVVYRSFQDCVYEM
jgi:hypothetical protein